MALIACHECKSQVSTTARQCPSCGAKVKKPVGKIGLIFAAIVVFAMLKCTIDRVDNPQTSRQTSPESPPDPKFTAAVIAGTALKHSLHDPSSLEWMAIGVNNDATVVCLVYRAKNKFGALVIEQTVISGGTMSNDSRTWKKNCSNKSSELHDLTFSKSAIN